MIECKWYLVFEVMGKLWILMERLAGLNDEHISQLMVYSNFIAVPAVLIYVLMLLDKRRNFFGHW